MLNEKIKDLQNDNSKLLINQLGKPEKHESIDKENTDVIIKRFNEKINDLKTENSMLKYV